MKKPEAFIIGLCAISFAVMVVALACGYRNPFELGAAYFVIAGIAGLGGIAQAKRQRSYDSWSARAMFMCPFFPVFLSPLWFACHAIVNGWKSGDPAIRYVGITLSFLACVPSLLTFFWLAGVRLRKTPNKAPEPTP